MSTSFNCAKGTRRSSLSLKHDLIERLELHKQQIYLTAQTQQHNARRLEILENRSWVERNAHSLEVHGSDIAATGLAGAEFDRI